MAANSVCECGVCVFGRQPEFSDYSCDLEQLVSDLGHVHNSVRYVRAHVSVRCSECDERLPAGALQCQQPNCSYALCLTCTPKHLGGDCWDSSQFVNQEISSEFECVLCSNICKQLVELQCGHTFGQKCLQRMMQAQPAPHNCPLCRAKFTPDKVYPGWSNRLKILSLAASCCHQRAGCSFRGSLAAVVRHQLSECGYRSVSCGVPGCHAVFAQLHQPEHHQLHCQIMCPAVGCGQKLSRLHITHHLLQQHLPRFLSLAEANPPTLLQQHNLQLQQEIEQLRQQNQQLQQENQQLQRRLQIPEEKKQEAKPRDINSIGRVVRYVPVFEQPSFCGSVAVARGRVYLPNSHHVDVVHAVSGGRVARWGFLGQTGQAAVGQPPRFATPCGVALDENRGRVYVVDQSNDCVVVLRLCDGMVEAVWGGQGFLQQFNEPCSLAYCPVTDLLYVVDCCNHCVKVLRGSDGQCVQILGTAQGNGLHQMNEPEGVALDLDHIYIADTGNHRVVVYSKHNGRFLFQIGQGEGSGATQFDHPVDVSVDSEAGVVYVADCDNYRVCVYRSCDGSYVRHFNVLQAGNTRAEPASVLWDAAAGVLYVTFMQSTNICMYEY